MQTADEARGWQSVGKLVFGERGFCTGVLIAPKLVVTAAHCLFDRDTGARVRDSTITFQAGWRNGRAEAYRGVRRSVAHPEYVYSGRDLVARVAWDLALLELDQPIMLPQIPPFVTGQAPRPDADVTVVSYAKDRSEVPSIERDCQVLAHEGAALVLTCDIDFGSSGAPVFALRDGKPEVVSVISAKAEYNGQKVALAVALDGALELLKNELSATETGRAGAGAGLGAGVGTEAGVGAGVEARTGAGRAGSGVRVLSGGAADRPASDADSGQDKNRGGAKFLRP
ncbi:trypsin-like serine protease [Xinfangfangia sp. D13-10-4-6]|nr:trypsin-like serine protease [Pseudogemmobacter hezensis]